MILTLLCAAPAFSESIQIDITPEYSEHAGVPLMGSRLHIQQMTKTYPSPEWIATVNGGGSWPSGSGGAGAG